MSDVDYRQLAEDIRNGNQKAEEDLCRAVQSGLMVILTVGMGMSTTDAEVVSQETLMMTLVKLRAGSIEKPGSLKSFIHNTGRYKALEHFRIKRIESGDDIDKLVAGGLTPFEIEMRNELRKELRLFIAELDQERDRDILNLSCLEDLDKKVVCEMLDLSPENFDRVLYRARKRLGEVIGYDFFNLFFGEG